MLILMCEFACWLTAAQAGAAPGVDAEPIAPGRIDAQIAALVKTVLADPLRTEAVERLARLRREQAQRRRQALDALIDGLRYYLAGRRREAASRLKVAAEVRQVRLWADALLVTRIDAIVRAAQPKPPPPGVGADRPVCSMCGNTGQADCGKCRGAGVVRCPTCNGRGMVKMKATGANYRNRSGVRARTVKRTCPTCSGACVVSCPICAGRGTRPCPLCKGANPVDEPPTTSMALAENEASQVKKVIAMACYLREGGLELDWPDVMHATVGVDGPDIRKLAARIRAERAKPEPKPEPKPVRPSP